MAGKRDAWVEAFRETAVGWLLGPEDSRTGLPDVIVLPMENPDVYDPTWIDEHARDLEQVRTLTLATVGDTRVAFSSPKFGAPAVAMATDVFAKAGFSAIVGLGFCGGLQPDLKCGELVLPCSAVRDEGASHNYAPADHPAQCSAKAAEAVKACAVEIGIDLRFGPVWMTDGILRETRDKVERHHSFGCLGVDMETAALYTVASAMEIDAVAILVVSDNVYECIQTDLGRLRGGWRRAAELVVKAARALGS
jgi:uridine phosphorylase